ncbi:1150_t:CDS:1, partial [Acaulospora morrowiae]
MKKQKRSVHDGTENPAVKQKDTKHHFFETRFRREPIPNITPTADLGSEHPSLAGLTEPGYADISIRTFTIASKTGTRWQYGWIHNQTPFLRNELRREPAPNTTPTADLGSEHPSLVGLTGPGNVWEK